MEGLETEEAVLSEGTVSAPPGAGGSDESQELRDFHMDWRGTILRQVTGHEGLCSCVVDFGHPWSKGQPMKFLFHFLVLGTEHRAFTLSYVHSLLRQGFTRAAQVGL